MVVLSCGILFDILQKNFWHKELSCENMSKFQNILEDQCSLSFTTDARCLNQLRAELFRLKTRGLRAKVKGGSQFREFLKTIQLCKYSWNVPIQRHECETLLQKQKEEMETLRKEKTDKQKELSALEEKFYSYIKSAEKQSTTKKNDLENQTIPTKRKPFEDCTPAYQSKIRKSDAAACKSALSFLEKENVKPISVLVSRNGKKEVLKIYDSENKENESLRQLDDMNTLIYILDSLNVSKEAYHELSMMYRTLPRSTAVQEFISKINSNFQIINTPDGLGVQQSFRQHLEDILSHLLLEDSNFVPDGNLIIKLSGDGTNVGKRLHLINFTFTIVNENRSSSATGNYPLCIVRTKENYLGLADALGDLREEIDKLQGGTVEVSGRKFSLKIMLGGDYKFLLIACGIPSIACQHVCVYCKCDKTEKSDLEKSLSMLDESKGARLVYAFDTSKPKRGKKDHGFSVRNPPIFLCITPLHVVIDNLHMFLRISDKLINLLIAELRVLDNISTQTTFNSDLDRKKMKHIASLERFLQRLGISFELHINRETKKLEFRELTGPEKLKIFSYFKASELYEDMARAGLVQKVWDDFKQLNELIKLEKPNADDVEKMAKEWCELYASTFQTKDITPYIHLLRYHVAELIRLHGNIVSFSQQGLEKLNDMITKQYFRGSSHKGSSALKQVMEKQNRIVLLESYKRKKEERYCSSCRESGHSILKCPNLNKE